MVRGRIPGAVRFATIIGMAHLTSTSPSIELRAVTKVYGAKRAVDGLTFTVRPGVVTGFLGPNGAGKSTTMRMILGIDRPTEGAALVGGAAFRTAPAPLRLVGALLDAKAVNDGRSARAHLLALARSNGIGLRRVAEVLDSTGLSDVAGKRVKGFSLGMCQRLGIAAALLGDPPVVMFDEPVNGLDPEGIAWIRHLLRNLAAEGRTVFLSSHLMSEMQHTADHLVVIGRGALLADTSMRAFIESNGRSRVIVRSPDLGVLAPLLRSAGASLTPLEAGAVDVEGLAADRIGDLAAVNAVRLHELTVKHASLEEAYMRITDNAVEYRTSELEPAR
jgi:ABC-2 type transport system ATP-binding protein